ncbi:MAG: hypothetical protein ABSE40_24100 [Candidatus Sulfotelmatobacter sp.]
MSDKITGAQAKVEWADKHIEDFEEELIRFQNTYPYKFTAQNDPETRQLVYYMTEVADVPSTVSLISGDVLQSLRSALDYLIWAHSENPTAFTSFPIFDPAKGEQSFLTRKIERLPPAARKIVTELKPYKGGNETLWKLHELNRTDKHRLLVASGTALRGFNMNRHLANIRHGGPTMVVRNGQNFVVRIAEDVYIPPRVKVFPLKAGDVLLIDPPDTKIDEDIDFRFEVAFNEPEISEGDSILETLKECLGLVREIVALFAKLP